MFCGNPGASGFPMQWKGAWKNDCRIPPEGIASRRPEAGWMKLNDAKLKALADGVYIPIDTAFNTASNITTPIESNRIFKFNAPTEGIYTLTIKNAKGEEVYKEAGGTDEQKMSAGDHFFFISTNASTEHPNTGNSSTYGKAPFAKGDYTFTIANSDKTVLSGSFTIA